MLPDGADAAQPQVTQGYWVPLPHDARESPGELAKNVGTVDTTILGPSTWGGPGNVNKHPSSSPEILMLLILCSVLCALGNTLSFQVLRHFPAYTS